MDPLTKPITLPGNTNRITSSSPREDRSERRPPSWRGDVASIIHVVLSLQLILAGGAALAGLLLILSHQSAAEAGLLALFGAGIALLVAWSRRFFIRNHRSSIALNSAAVALAWILGSLLASLPIFFLTSFFGSGSPTNEAFGSWLNAWYEGASSLTSSGLTVTGDSTELPASVQLWRSVCQWVGGAGLTVFALLVLVPAQNGKGIYAAEARDWNPNDDQRITVKHILVTYLGLTATCALTFGLLGMPYWENLNHSLIIVSTGGLTVTTDSFTSYRPALQTAAMVFMLLSALSFASLFLLVTGRWKTLSKRSGLRAFLVWTGFLIGVAGILALLAPQSALRQTIFNLVSGITTCGVATGSSSSWIAPVIPILIIAMFIGGGSNSTAGGWKVDRAFWSLKTTHRIVLTRWSCPRQHRWNGYQLREEATTHRSRHGIVLLALYLFFALGGFLLLRSSYPAEIGSDRVLFQTISALSAVGLSMELTGPDRPTLAKIFEISLMLIGRLEITAFLYLPVVVVKEMRETLREKTKTSED